MTIAQMTQLYVYVTIQAIFGAMLLLDDLGLEIRFEE